MIFTGRFQHDFAVVDADQGETDEWNIRRVRFGPRITLFVTFCCTPRSKSIRRSSDPFYVRLTDAYVAWHEDPCAVDHRRQAQHPVHARRRHLVKGARHDRSQQPDEQHLVSQEYLPGLSVSGRETPRTYRGSMYSSGEANREFGKFDGGIFTLAVLGYDFAKRLGVGEAVLTGNYLYQQPDVNNTFTRRYEHITSVNFRLDDGRWGVRERRVHRRLAIWANATY